MVAKVSIIMPSLNVAKYIRECIESVLHQSLNELEIICIDAGSTDGTREILERYAKADSRIRLVHSEVKSYGAQVNRGLELATGKYVAIVETDDFVDKQMYERLYFLAEEFRLDFVMDDYCTFYETADGTRNFCRCYALQNHKDLYNKVLSGEQLAEYLDYADSNLWRGIYCKDFLSFNCIKLNETKGAAYQDICFMHRVRKCVKRAMYVDEVGYWYRTDRALSSSNSMNGLKYAQYEYQFLFTYDRLPEWYLGKAYYLMTVSCTGEIIALLSKCGYVLDEENVRCYKWFKKQFEIACERGILSLDMSKEKIWNDALLLMESLDDFSRLLKEKSEERERIFSELQRKNVIVFGAGQRGRDAVLKLISKEIRVKAICDNNSELWGNELFGTRIISLSEALQTIEQPVFLIACKEYTEDIQGQLLKNEVCTEQIYIYKK